MASPVPLMMSFTPQYVSIKVWLCDYSDSFWGFSQVQLHRQK